MRVLCGAWDVWLQKVSTPFFSPCTTRLLRSGKGRGDPRGKGYLLGTAKGWGFPKAFFLNWAEFFNKGPVLSTGFYLLTKSVHKTGEKTHSLLRHAGLSWRAAALCLAREILDMLTDISKFHFQLRCLDKPLKREKVFLLALDPRWDADVQDFQAQALPSSGGRGEDCMASSCRLGVWGRAIGVTCDKRCPQRSHSPLVACKAAQLDKDCQGRKGPRAGISSFSHKWYCLCLQRWSAHCLCNAAGW